MAVGVKEISHSRDTVWVDFSRKNRYCSVTYTIRRSEYETHMTEDILASPNAFRPYPTVSPVSSQPTIVKHGPKRKQTNNLHLIPMGSSFADQSL